MKKVLCALAVVFLLSGCSLFGGNVPEGFSRESYDDMVDAYRTYEQQKIDNEIKGDILEGLVKYRKLADEGKLTEAELTVRDLITQLTLAYVTAHNGLTNETYDIIDLVPNTLTVEIGTGLRIEDIKEAEDQVLSYLELEALPIPEEEEQLKRGALAEASRRLLEFVSVGELATPYKYEDSYVVYRKDRNEYYVASAFIYKDRSYKYDMILDADLNFVDAYMVDDIGGLLSKPMNDDNRPLWPEVAAEQSEGESSETANDEEESSNSEDFYGSDQEGSADMEETAPDSEAAEPPESDLPEWDKAEFLGGTLTDMADALSEIRQINKAAMSMDMNVESANDTLMTLSELRNQLEFMILDPMTSQHFSQTELEMVKQILGGLQAVIEEEQQMINDPSTQNIQIADSVTEEAQSLIDMAQFQY